jgi:hypothetical protein
MNKLDKILNVCAAYGIVQVLAQDFGIKTGTMQRDIMHSIPIQFILFYSGAWKVVDDYVLALIATLLYFILKYIISDGKTSKVCFESV